MVVPEGWGFTTCKVNYKAAGDPERRSSSHGPCLARMRVSRPLAAAVRKGASDISRLVWPAYNRAQRLPERLSMMQAWADYMDKLRDDSAESIVVPIPMCSTEHRL